MHPVERRVYAFKKIGLLAIFSAKAEAMQTTASIENNASEVAYFG